MMRTVAELSALARQLLADFDGKTPGRSYPDGALRTRDAYALQAEIARLREGRGERVIGYKIGCTSTAIQQQLGIHEPIYARLFETGRLATGARLSHSSYANLAVEAELAVRLATDVTEASLGAPDPWKVIDSVFPVIELHHYVLRSRRSRGQELIAANGLHAGFVAAAEFDGRIPASVGHLKLIINDTHDETDQPWTMGDPIAALRWLAIRLGECGLLLSCGDVVLTGSPLPLRPVAAGSRIAVEAAPFEEVRAEIVP